MSDAEPSDETPSDTLGSNDTPSEEATDSLVDVGNHGGSGPMRPRSGGGPARPIAALRTAAEILGDPAVAPLADLWSQRRQGWSNNELNQKLWDLMLACPRGRGARALGLHVFGERVTLHTSCEVLGVGPRRVHRLKMLSWRAGRFHVRTNVANACGTIRNKVTRTFG